MFSMRSCCSSATASSNGVQAASSRHALLLRQFNEDIFKRNVLTDVELIVEGQVFKSHRAVLVCFSPYLKKELLSEDGNPTSNKVHIPKVTKEEFGVLLQYMYTGDLNVTCNSFLGVYQAASILEMQNVMQECLQLLEPTDDIRTYFYMYVTARKMGIQTNWLRALRLLTHRFEEIVCTPEFLQLDVDFVTEILSAQNIGARSEVIVFLAALKWLNCDYSKRSEHEVTVMKCVRFSSMTMNEVVACYHPPFLPQVLDNPDVINLLFRATCYITASYLGQATWFRNFGNPKRNLVVDELPMELWHQRSSNSECNIQPKYVYGLPSYNDFEDQPGNGHRSRQDSKRNVKEVWSSENNLKTVAQEVIRNVGQQVVDLQDNRKNQAEIDIKKVQRPVKASKQKRILERGRSNLTMPFETNTPHISSDPTEIEVAKPSRKPTDSKPNVLVDHKQNPERDITLENTNGNSGHPSRKPSSATKPSPRKVSEYLPFRLFSGTRKNESPPKENTSSPSKQAAVKVPTEETVKIETKYDQVGIGEEELGGCSSSLIWTSDDFPDRPKKEKKPSILVIGGMNPKNLHTVGIGGAVLNFDPKTDKWVRYNSLPSSRHNHCAALFNNALYVIGGCDPNETLNQNRYIATRSCFKLDIMTQQWATLQEMNFKRYDHGLALFGEHIFVIGGQDDGERLLKSVEVFNIRRNKWKVLSSEMCCGRKAMGVTTFSGRIWLAGGLIQPDKELNFQVVSHVDCFDPKLKKWVYNVNSLPSPRCYCSLTVWSDLMCCIGGMVIKDRETMNPSNEVWFYNKDMWEEGPSLPIPRMGSVALVFNNSLYVVGGFDPEADVAIRNVNVLSHGAISWEIAAPLPSHLFGLSAVSVEMHNQSLIESAKDNAIK